MRWASVWIASALWEMSLQQLCVITDCDVHCACAMSFSRISARAWRMPLPLRHSASETAKSGHCACARMRDMRLVESWTGSKLGPPQRHLTSPTCMILRSAINNDFYVPSSRSRYGDRMFSVAGPRLWNSLPAVMKKTCCLVTFKRLLKTHLFWDVYEV